MKTIRPLLFLATAGTLLATVPSLPAQDTMRLNTSGRLTLPLSLDDPQISGTLPPARLGTGTPTSATVLRGDGTWSGLTATGNTIAATSNLLMGDGAGNALAVPDATNLLTVLKTRLETRQAAATPVVNLLPPSTDGYRGFYNGTLNPDGTITVPANGRVAWRIPGDAGGLTLYGYVAATGEQPAGALKLVNYPGYDLPGSYTTVAPGVYRSQFLSTAIGSGNLVDVYLSNATGAPITVYYPVLAYTDDGLSLLASHADLTPAPVSQVLDFDFTHFSSADRSPRYSLEKQVTAAADSVTGNNANAGTLYSPKFTLAQPLANGSVFGLYRGSVFRDSLPLVGKGTGRGIEVRDVAFGQVKSLPVVSALDPAPNAAFTDNGDGTYSYLWTPAEAITNDGYGNVYAVEIDTLQEARPMAVAARRRMIDAASQAAVAATPGTVYVQAPGTGAGQSGSATQWKATVHPSDDHAPGSGEYRYEVVSRVTPAPWYTGNTVGDGAMSGLMLVGSSSGYGPLSGPTGFVGDRLVLLHGTTHNAVLGGGSLARSVIYEGGDNDSIMVAWYANDPTGLSWTMNDCLFYAGSRPTDMVLSHSGGSAAYARGDVSRCAFVGAGRSAGGALSNVGLGYNNVLAGTVDSVYMQGIARPFGNLPAAIETKGSVFQQVSLTNVVGRFHDNLVAAESASPGATALGVILTSGSQAANNLFWAHGTGAGAGASGFQAYVTSATSSHNIVVIDPASPTTVANYTQGPVAGLTLDFNLVIYTGVFHTSGPNGGYTNPADYQAGSAPLDAHSLFVDLSGDARGLRAVFADPANGDFRWAQTDVARRCAAYCRANHVGPATVTSHWPVVPTVDEAVRLLTDL